MSVPSTPATPAHKPPTGSALPTPTQSTGLPTPSGSAQLRSMKKSGLRPPSYAGKSKSLFQYSKICVKRPLSKRPKIGFQDHLSLNTGQKYCRMLRGEHSAILLTFIKLPLVIKTFILSIFEWSFYTVLL